MPGFEPFRDMTEAERKVWQEVKRGNSREAGRANARPGPKTDGTATRTGPTVTERPRAAEGTSAARAVARTRCSNPAGTQPRPKHHHPANSAAMPGQHQTRCRHAVAAAIDAARAGSSIRRRSASWQGMRQAVQPGPPPGQQQRPPPLAR